mmetsp:Transcript_413/g.512  ORF Transcript_413/g.512 Transcript_413/m.512 type:complete len:95 (-) Transcript_413:255-539(-)
MYVHKSIWASKFYLCIFSESHQKTAKYPEAEMNDLIGTHTKYASKICGQNGTIASVSVGYERQETFLRKFFAMFTTLLQELTGSYASAAKGPVQ